MDIFNDLAARWDKMEKDKQEWLKIEAAKKARKERALEREADIESEVQMNLDPPAQTTGQQYPAGPLSENAEDRWQFDCEREADYESNESTNDYFVR